MADEIATAEPSTTTNTETLDKVVIRFAGDSGDGMQVAGSRFTDASALFGNDLATLPSFPAEIRAPAGTLPGVSSFQVQIADFDILTAGDSPDCLVAMNPAALKKNLKDLQQGGTLVLNTDAFDERNLAKAGYETDPLEDGTLDGYRVIKVPMDDLTKEAVKDTGVSGRSVLRSKNFFALGLLAWLFHRPTQPTIDWAQKKFARTPEVAAANVAAFQAGYTFGEATEAAKITFEIKPAALRPGTYTNVNGNTALAWGLIAASKLSGLPLFYGTYPITPASDILHELARHKNFGVRTFQAEDEIAGVGSAIGAAFAGSLAVTGSSGPGIALKSEAISLAFTMELPLIVINVQRGGPSTGLPTKPEQSDLLFSLYGRHGESPIPVLAIASPSDAFELTIEAARIAIKYMTPVLLLSDNQVANGSEPWMLPDVNALESIDVQFAEHPNGPNGTFLPYMRDIDTFARPWAVPGTAGLEHRIGGLEKEAITGNVSYDPANHQLMTDSRAWKVANIVNDIPDLEVAGDEDAELLVLGWGSTFGSIRAAARRVRLAGGKVATLHLRHLNPMPQNLGEILHRYEKILIPELNTGQLRKVIRAEFLVDAKGLNKVAGEPFKISEITEKIEEMTK
ncbi:MAG: pyruvate flavodoxin/ferredoxin oxidoreductase domain protein [Acidimicrobiia bacterium]|nr:pyruvate flavodoxin/ferredoxin oxidoreductase domain protein [Acidimicrobiia bacterium]